MNLAGPLHLAWRYIARHRTRTALLALSLGLTLALPLAMRLFVQLAQSELRARAEATPLVLGAKGSALELTLNALYFRRRGVEGISMRAAQDIRDTGLADAVPLHVRFHALEAPIVGTTLDYFSFRNLRVAQGHMIGRLGDCVIGARLARERGLTPGASVMSSPEQVFDLAGVYPLKMRITGVLAENHSADDDAIFVDVKTAWVIEGIAHGHEDLAVTKDAINVQEKQDGNIVGSKAVPMFTEITDKNIGSFHFHAEMEALPLTAVLALPRDTKAQALMLGRFANQDKSATLQLVQPTEQMDALLSTLFQAERLALVAFAALAIVVLLIAALVFALSFKLRRREFATLEDVGISRTTLGFVKLFEILMVGTLSLLIVLVTWWLVREFGLTLVRLGLR
jgi:putative ABC transport system permease protein